METIDLETMREARVGDVGLAYVERGEGTPVVLVHGSVSDARVWGSQLPALAADHRTIAYSRRYSPPNEPIAAGAGDPMEPHVGDLLGLIETLDLPPAHLVGSSWGAFITLLAAIERPEAVRSLTLLEPPAMSLFVSIPPRPAELLPLFLRRPRTAIALLRFGAGTVSPAQKAFDRDEDERAMEIFGTGVLGREAFEAMPDERRLIARENLPTLKAQLPLGFPPLRDEDVAAVSVPALLLGAERSPAIFARLLDRLEELLPDARRELIADASHGMQEQQPEHVNAAIRRFLGDA